MKFFVEISYSSALQIIFRDTSYQKAFRLISFIGAE